MTDKQQRRNDAVLAAQGRRFSSRLAKPAYPSPTLLKLMIFRMSRTSMSLMLDDSYRDYTYYRDHGWFESGYYYSTRLNPVKRLAGRLFDWTSARMTRN